MYMAHEQFNACITFFFYVVGIRVMFYREACINKITTKKKIEYLVAKRTHMKTLQKQFYLQNFEASFKSVTSVAFFSKDINIFF